MKTSSKPICAVLLTYWGECAAFSGGSFERDDTLDIGILVRVSPECAMPCGSHRGVSVSPCPVSPWRGKEGLADGYADSISGCTLVSVYISASAELSPLIDPPSERFWPDI